jgi:hypothetical protein
MMGQHTRSEALFYYFRLEDQIPENHLLRLMCANRARALDHTPIHRMGVDVTVWYSRHAPFTSEMTRSVRGRLAIARELITRTLET